ncbi:sigma 54-interacting transcriptional regulator [Enterococcus dongliensis]|uniref:sigma 54-interacting transcriptional regulator n=1 Tax=Enterococcus dongliensis TaxID=2559925 RepID=UPI0028925AB6|nr:sigma 54-interacting transcriptional regulator [Enterococcus dongliensis]MDT2704227.1 sigma 54-interacting transcriptional regulator [Enterococcus dongliensis]
MEKIEEKIGNYFFNASDKIELDKLNQCFISTQQIEAVFELSRTNVSKILNRLVKESVLFKINSRPVLFASKKAFEEHFAINLLDSYDSIEKLICLLKGTTKSSVFQKMIGYNKSLANAIEQMKTAAYYPGTGLPMMITGDTGVGKSYFAKISHEFMISNDLISPRAPFKTLNCAQYYNNPELLSGLLFGYCKGAFTGAIEDHAGLLEEADDGVLFLDEIHRLSPEGQEKLFTFMDKQEFSRIGEIEARHAKIRLIFATTEPDDYFLDTFLRRIPIHIYIPNLRERDILEKRQIIDFLYLKESKNIKKIIEVTPRVLNLLLQSDYKGNIGELENVIKYSCGSAVAGGENEEGKTFINLKDLPNNIYQKLNLGQPILNLDGENVSYSPITKINQKIENSKGQEHIFVRIVEKIRNKTQLSINDSLLIEQISVIMTSMIDELIYQTKNENQLTIEKFIVETMQELFRDFDRRYKVHYDGDFVTSISHYIYKYVLMNHYEKIDVPLDITTTVNRLYPKEIDSVGKLLPVIENRLDISFSKADKLIFTLFFSTLQYEISFNNINALIVAHGYATASSICNVVNKMLGKRIFAGIDMPIESTVFDISEKVLDYLSENKAGEGLLILIDMGSLNLLYNELKQSISTQLLFVDQLTTVLTLEIGNLIDQGNSLEEIFKKINEPILPNVQLFSPVRKREQAIITTCFTGIGTAVQIQQLLLDCFDGILTIHIFPVEYGTLKAQGVPKEIENKYDVKAIVGTDNPQIADINFISLDRLITDENDGKVNHLFVDLLPESLLSEVNNRLVKSFSLIRVIDSLTILDTKKILKLIEDVIDQLEDRLELRLSNARKIGLYVHISCMFERLIRQTEIQSFPDLENFSFEHQKEIRVIQDVLSVMERIYSVKVPLPELCYIHNIIYIS